MKHIVKLAGAALLASAVGAFASGAEIQGYRIDGYLDQMPPGSRAVETVRLQAGRHTRTLFVVERRQALQDYGISSGVTDLFSQRRPLTLSGSPEDVAKVMTSPEGARLNGLFLLPRSYPVLFVDRLTTDKPTEGVAELMPGDQG